MTPRELLILAVMALATLAIILAERANSQRGIWESKPIASAAFVTLGYPFLDRWMFAALVLAFLGDLCLIPKDRRIFRAGILLFLLAHVALGVAFWMRGINGMRAALAFLPLAIAATIIAQWILPKAPRELKPAVIAYMVVITVMVALAAGTSEPWLLGAALAFWTNDILVARDRFVTRSWLNRAVGLPLYYGAMAVFALFTSGSLA